MFSDCCDIRFDTWKWGNHIFWMCNASFAYVAACAEAAEWKCILLDGQPVLVKFLILFSIFLFFCMLHTSRNVFFATAVIFLISRSHQLSYDKSCPKIRWNLVNPDTWSPVIMSGLKINYSKFLNMNISIYLTSIYCAYNISHSVLFAATGA